MPRFVKILLELAAKNPAMLADILDLVKRILDLLAKYPDLGPTLIEAFKGTPPAK
jgi:hypothetical protein